MWGGAIFDPGTSCAVGFSGDVTDRPMGRPQAGDLGGFGQPGGVEEMNQSAINRDPLLGDGMKCLIALCLLLCLGGGCGNETGAPDEPDEPDEQVPTIQTRIVNYGLESDGRGYVFFEVTNSGTVYVCYYSLTLVWADQTRVINHSVRMRPGEGRSQRVDFPATFRPGGTEPRLTTNSVVGC